MQANGNVKKVIGILGKILLWALVAFTVFIMIFTIITVTTVDKNDRSLFGIKFYIVQTDSMSLSENNADMDVHFNAGDIVLIGGVEDPKALEPGDIIAFLSTNSVSYGETVTHMIREVKKTDDGRVLGYVTYGTNTGTNDEALVEPEYVLGEYVGKLPGVGNFFAFVKSTPGYIVCILVPFVLLILYNGINVIRLFRRYKKEQTAAMDAEKEAIAKERAQNEEMLRELLALKESLAQQGMAPVAQQAPPVAPEAPVEEQPAEAPAEAPSEQAPVEEATEQGENGTAKDL